MLCNWGWTGGGWHFAAILFWSVVVLAGIVLVSAWAGRRRAAGWSSTACPACGGAVRPSYLRCPHCGNHLKGHCPECSRLVESAWTFCPECGAEQPTRPGNAGKQARNHITLNQKETEP